MIQCTCYFTKFLKQEYVSWKISYVHTVQILFKFLPFSGLCIFNFLHAHTHNSFVIARYNNANKASLLKTLKTFLELVFYLDR